MDVNFMTAIGQLVGSVGFPIVCCIILFVQNNKFQQTLTKFQETLKDISEEIRNIKSKLE